MTLQQIQYVLTISRTKSMNKAAKLLYVSQPSLTSAVRELEQELGITIFSRSSRGVTVTNEGAEFLAYASQMQELQDLIMEKYAGGAPVKRHFCVSAQHYSFAVKAFVETVSAFGISEYEFAFRECPTRDVISDVARRRSEIGILYLSDYNRTMLMHLLKAEGLIFHPLIRCSASVYLWKEHPLAKRETLSLDDLAPYPCISFEQGDERAFYLAEEILPDHVYPKLIKTCDRATNLNLMVGLLGYTLCSGIICEELNGTDFVTVPFRDDSTGSSNGMEIGYIVRQRTSPSRIGAAYIDALKTYLSGLSAS